jgi:peroxiredoxin
MVDEVENEYGDRAEFIHVEIWRDFQAQWLNDAAEQWLWRNDTGQEPWVFVIGADGRITARFDNVATRGELEPLLERLPRR